MLWSYIRFDMMTEEELHLRLTMVLSPMGGGGGGGGWW